MSKTPNTLDKMLEAYEAPKNETDASADIENPAEPPKIEIPKPETPKKVEIKIEEEDEYKIFVGGLPGSTTKGNPISNFKMTS